MSLEQTPRTNRSAYARPDETSQVKAHYLVRLLNWEMES
jgi:hypothetical protein